MNCTCNSGFRYVKGVAVPCKRCNPDGKLLVKTEDSNEQENNRVNHIVSEDVNDILMIPDSYRDKTYSRQKINSMLMGVTDNQLFNKLDEILLDVRKGVIRQENCFFFASQKFDLDLWVYTFMRDAFKNHISVVPYISADVLKGIWQLTNETVSKSNIKESLDYMNSQINLTWYDLLMANIAVIKLPAVFNNSILAIIMSLASQRILYNRPTYLVSYWKSSVVKKVDGGGFIFKEEDDYGMNLFTVYEHAGHIDEPKIKKI